MYSILNSVDIGLFLFGFILLIVAKKLPIDREKNPKILDKKLIKGKIK